MLFHFPTISVMLTQLHIDSHHQSVHAYARSTSRLNLTKRAFTVNNIEQEIAHLWESVPFKQASDLVRDVLCNGGSNCTRLVQYLDEHLHGSHDIFRALYEGKWEQSMEIYDPNVNEIIHKKRRKRSVCLRLAYEGQHFCGWQRQPNSLPSVQETVEKIIESSFVDNGRADIRVSGRTDAGVHAVGQIARVRITPPAILTSNYSEFANEVLHALNVGAKASNYTWRCLSVNPVSEKFHPTFSAVSRSYIYVIDAAAVHDLLSKIFPTDLELTQIQMINRLLTMTTYLNSLLESLVGNELDYYSFSYGKVKTDTTLCCIQHAKVRVVIVTQSSKEEMAIVFELTGDRFLRRMVRMIVGTSIQLAIEKISNECSKNHVTNDSASYVKFNVDSLGCFTLIDICHLKNRTTTRMAPPGGLIFLGASFG